MSAVLSIDTSDYRAKQTAIEKLPDAIKHKVFHRAMGRMSSATRTAVVRHNAKRIKIAQKHVRAATTARYSSVDSSIVVKIRSSQISLYKLGARQTRRGVTVSGRGSYRSAFIATMSNGHTGVFKRKGRNRTPIQELYGPNPASDAVNSPDVYVDLMIDIINERLLGRIAHELGRVLPR